MKKYTDRRSIFGTNGYGTGIISSKFNKKSHIHAQHGQFGFIEILNSAVKCNNLFLMVLWVGNSPFRKGSVAVLNDDRWCPPRSYWCFWRIWHYPCSYSANGMVLYRSSPLSSRSHCGWSHLNFSLDTPLDAQLDIFRPKSIARSICSGPTLSTSLSDVFPARIYRYSGLCKQRLGSISQ